MEAFRKLKTIVDLVIFILLIRGTWSNNRKGSSFTKEIIDKALASQKGLDLLLGSVCNVFSAIKSDHSPY